MLLTKKYISTAPSTFYPIGAKLIIEGQEFAAQSRTLLFIMICQVMDGFQEI